MRVELPIVFIKVWGKLGITLCAFLGTCCGLQTKEAGASVSESGDMKALAITHQNGSFGGTGFLLPF